MPPKVLSLLFSSWLSFSDSTLGVKGGGGNLGLGEGGKHGVKGGGGQNLGLRGRANFGLGRGKHGVKGGGGQNLGLRGRANLGLGEGAKCKHGVKGGGAKHGVTVGGGELGVKLTSSQWYLSCLEYS